MTVLNAPSTNTIASEIVTFQQGMPATLVTFCTTPITANASPQPFMLASMNGITSGMTLNVDVTNQESVVITSITSGIPSAVFTKNHGLLGNTWTIGTGTNPYTLVKLGSVTDPTDVTNFCSIFFEEGATKPWSNGWRVDDRVTFLIESGFDQTDSTLAEQTLLNVRDVLIPIYMSQLSLNSTPGAYLTLLTGTPDRTAYKVYPNGRIYRVHHLTVAVASQYNIVVGQ